MTSSTNGVSRLKSVGQRLAGGILLSAAGIFGLPAIASAAICPTTGNTNTDCGFILTIGPGNVVTGAAVAGANPYDGSDDSLVGVINNSGAAYTGSFVLTSGTDIFGFEGDGICTYITCTWSNPTTYEGPLSTFSGINAAGTSGTVTITGLAAGATTFFSLEESPSTIAAGGGVGVNPIPEPSTYALMALGLAGVGFAARRRKSA